jgi:ABC-type transport system involved in multi-copper enzyme maturation permease subunit
MVELLSLFLLFGGGLGLALVFMVMATFRRARLSTLVTFVTFSFFCLVAQGGCWSVAAGINRPPTEEGRGAQDWDWYHAVSSAFILCAVWASILFFTRGSRRSSDTLSTEPQKPEPFDY